MRQYNVTSWLAQLCIIYIYLVQVTLTTFPKTTSITIEPLNETNSHSSVINNLDTKQWLNVSSIITNNTILNESKHTVHIGNNTTSHPDAHLSDTHSTEQLHEEINTHNIIDTTNTTQTNSSTENIPVQSHLNLAIIPGFAVFVFLIVVCLKCCNWFRAYTRAGDKDEPDNKYFTISQDGDEEFGNVDMTSESASTTYYDTVSSYCSFLKRSGNETTLSSMRSLRPEFIRQLSIGTPRRNVALRMYKDADVSGINSKSIESPGSYSPRSDSVLSECTRTLSVSSEDTDPLSASMSESFDLSNSQNRRQQRFKVSFVTETETEHNSNKDKKCKQSPVHSKVTHSTNTSPKIEARSIIRSSLKKLPPSMYDRRRVRSLNSARTNFNKKAMPDYIYKDTKLASNNVQTVNSFSNGVNVETADVGTQTDKSFRYNMLKGKRRHYSDSGVDDCLAITTIHELCTNNQTSDANDCDILQSSNTCDKPLNTSISVNSSDKENKQHCVQEKRRRKYSLTDSESSDDVFIACDSSSSLLSTYITDGNSDQKQHYAPRDVINCNQDESITCGIKGNRIQSDDITIHSQLSTSPSISDIGYKTQSCINFHEQCTCINRKSLTFKAMEEGNDPETKRIRDNCVILHKAPRHIYNVGEVNVDCEMYPQLLKTNIRSLCSLCAEQAHTHNNLNNSNININSDLRKVTPKFERNKSLVSDELTSSMTSLESSGYAEISSDSSI